MSISKSRRRPQPAKPATRIDWQNIRRHDFAPAKQRQLLNKAVRAFDDVAVSIYFSFAMHQAQASQDRADLAELARIKATCAIIPASKVPARELKVIRRRARS